jgi:hypothetical protein
MQLPTKMSEKKIQNTINSKKILKIKGFNSGKNNSITSKQELELLSTKH